ncbi:unnamed protein product, partial [Staurois parvus]
MIIFIAEIAGAVVALVYSSVAQSFLQSVLTPVLQTQYGDKQDVTSSWNNTMKDLKCCGLNNYTDFNNSYYVKNKGVYPEACCNFNTTSSCTENFAHTSKVPGCFNQILDLLKKKCSHCGRCCSWNWCLGAGSNGGVHVPVLQDRQARCHPL